MRRFAFGRNWQSFSRSALTLEKINQAKEDFLKLVCDIDFKGKTFLDIGFGQGLTLMIAQNIGAQPVGLDIDRDNISALDSTAKFFHTQELPKTIIGSILDDAVVSTLQGYKGFDIVHSWGVLHHTGDMAKAVQNAAAMVKSNGFFILAIYNKHWTSPLWLFIKWLYNVLPAFLQRISILFFYPIIYAAKWMVTGQNPKRQERGMDFYHDVVDWVGGYPYEYESAGGTIQRLEPMGFECVKSVPAGVPTGCNQFIFRKIRS